MEYQIYLNARCKTLENKLLTQSKYNQMIDSGDSAVALRILNESKIGNGSVTDPLEYSTIIQQEENKFNSILSELGANEDLKNYFLLPTDFFNSEVLVKSRISHNDKLKQLIKQGGMVETEVLERAIDTKEFSCLPDRLSDTLKEIFSDEKNTTSGKRIADIFRRNMYSLKVKDKIIQKIIDKRIDLMNIESSFRVDSEEEFTEVKIGGGTLKNEIFGYIINRNAEGLKKEFSDCCFLKEILEIMNTKTEIPLFNLEKKIDDTPLEVLDEYRYIEDGMIPVIRYLFRYQAQIKNIRIIMCGLINGMDNKEIKTRLRWNYER